MLFHIANLFESDRRSAIAGEDLPMGAVVKVVGTTGERVLFKVALQADLVDGKCAVAAKVQTEPLGVTSSTVNADRAGSANGVDLGSRITTIKSGDQIIEVRRGAICEYDPSLLHESLDPARGGTLPNPGDAMAVKDSLFAAAGASGAITSPVLGRCFDVVNNKIRIELLTV